MKIYIDLFISFCKIGLLTLGGGMSMLPMLRRETIFKFGWITEEQLLDWFAVSQCMPGIIAVNVSTFIGRHVKGWKGALSAVLGVIFPSFVVIVALAAFITNFSDLPWVQSAFAGIRACVCVIVFNEIIKLFKYAVKDVYSLILLVIVFAGSAFLNLSPVLFVLFSAIAGVLIQVVKERRKL